MVALPLVAPTNDWCSSNGTADCNNDGTAMCVYKLNKDGSSNEFKKITPECKTSATADNKCKPATVSATPEVAINEDELCCTKPKAANEHVKLDTKCVRMIGVLTNLTWRNKRKNKTGSLLLLVLTRAYTGCVEHEVCITDKQERTPSHIWEGRW